jgi:hypothetical protein
MYLKQIPSSAYLITKTMHMYLQQFLTNILISFHFSTLWIYQIVGLVLL